MHKNLKKILEKNQLLPLSRPPEGTTWLKIIENIDSHYEAVEKEKALLENALNISSLEIKDRWDKITQLFNESQRLNARLDMQNQSLKMISKNISIDVVAKSLIKGQILTLGALGGSIYQVDTDELQLQNPITFQLPEHYCKAVNTVSIGESVGTCGKAAYTKSPVYTKNIRICSNWKDFQEIVLTTNFMACWSVPILSSEKNLLGTFALYFDTERLPTQDEVQSLMASSQIAVIALEKEQNKKMLEREQMKALSASRKAAIGEMAGGIAHEINNPLTIINGFIKKLELYAKKNQLQSEHVNPIIEGVQKTIVRINKIINALKIYSREESESKKISYNLIDVINDSMSLCSEKIKASGIELSFNSTNDNIKINCDPIKLSQVIINLLSNALDAVSKSEGAWIKINVLEENNIVKVKIIDSGEGIPEPIREKMMLPFFTTKEIGKGTGIGLSISDGIIKEHYGKFYCDHKQRNTCFVIELPLEEKG